MTPPDTRARDSLDRASGGLPQPHTMLASIPWQRVAVPAVHALVGIGYALTEIADAIKAKQ